MIERPEYSSQVPAAARTPVAVQSPAQYTTTPLGQTPKPRAPMGPYLLPATEVLSTIDTADPKPQGVPHQALQSLVSEPTPAVQQPEAEKPKPEKPKQQKPVKHSRDLQDYSYDLSLPELARVRQEQPKAGQTVETETTATPMSWDQYDKLTPDQRAAVDFNSLLVQAREIDLKTDPKFYTEEQKKQYALDVESIFGAQGGSDTMGFRTVELLKKIDFKAIGQDLDEYLSLERAISSDELKDFTFSKDEAKQLASFNPMSLAQPGIANDYVAARTPENLAAIDTAAIQAALSAYKAKAQSVGANARDIVTGLGVQMPAPMMMPPGYERGGEYESMFDQTLKDAYDFLKANPNEAGMAAIFQDFKDRNWTPEDQQQLWTYLNDRTMRERQYFGDKGADQIRTALGWD